MPVMVAAGDGHTCWLTSAGAVQCWGSNSAGQLGDGTQEDRWTPVDVIGLGSEVKAISAGGAHTCAATAVGAVKCWGDNRGGQLGDGTTTSRLTPVEVVGLSSGVRDVDAGGWHTCAVTTEGAVKCWGSGDLGDGSWQFEEPSTPVAVVGLASGVKAVTTGSTHTCAVTTGGAVKCWGFGFWASLPLGDGTADARSMPVDVVGLASGLKAVSAGQKQTCAVTAGAGVQCWGGETAWGAESLTPVQVAGLGSGVAAVSVGGDHVCVVTAAGAVQCWGDNGSGQLGDGTRASRDTPANVAGLGSGVQAISAGRNHTCALTTLGAVMCWGANHSGQLGDGRLRDRLTPVAVATAGIPTDSRVIATIKVGNAPMGVAVDPGTQDVYVANTGDNTVSVIDASARQVTGTIKVGDPWSVAVDPGSHLVYATTASDDTVSVVDSATHRVTGTIKVGDDPWSVAVDPVTHTVYVTNAKDGTLSVIDTTTARVTGTIEVGQYADVAVDPGTHTVYVTNSGDDTLLVIDAASMRVTGTVKVGDHPSGVAVDPGSHTVSVTNLADDTVSVIDAATHQVTGTIRVGDEPSSIAVDPGRRIAYVGNVGDDTVSVIDTNTGHVTATIPVASSPYYVAVDPVTHIAYVTNYRSKTVSVIQVE